MPTAVVAELSLRYRDRLVACAERVLGDRHEAEDVAQEVLIRATRELPSGEVRSLPGWLLAVTYRVAIDRVRARGRHAKAIAALPAASMPAGVEVAFDTALARERLAGLDEPYRTALTLRYLEGLPFETVAARMGTIERTARTWVGRGLSRLRERMGVNP